MLNDLRRIGWCLSLPHGSNGRARASLGAWIVAVVVGGEPAVDSKLTTHVNVFVGTDSNGNTFPGATLPFGMIQLTPMMDKSGWNYNSGYHRGADTSKSPLAGFAMTAFSGVGLNDGGDFIILPTRDGYGKTRGSLLHDSGESASPGYYRCAVELQSKAGIIEHADVELVATRRAGMLRIRLPGGGTTSPVGLLLNMKSTQDKLVSAQVWKRDESLLMAKRQSKPTHHCSTDHTTYAAIETSVSGMRLEMLDKGHWHLQLQPGVKEVLVRVGLSHVNEEGALQNLRTELAMWDFDTVVDDASAIWNNALGRVRAEGSADVLARLYTALYHTMLGPTLLSDVDQRYRFGGEGEIQQGNFNFYSSFSLWDTYRAEHPLLNLLFPELAADFAKSLLAIRKKLQRLPRWVMYGKETNCMIGYPAAVMLSEAALKGLLHSRGEKDIDLEQMTLDAVIETSNMVDGGDILDKLRTMSPSLWVSMSKSLENAWADACISKFAGMMGRTSVQEHYLQRSHLYRFHYHPGKKLLLPRHCRRPPCFAENHKNEEGFIDLPENVADQRTSAFYVEGTPLQYNFMVPHDLSGMSELMGGKAALKERLDDYFLRSGVTAAAEIRDLETGHYGGHVQGNEPGHHVPYMYNFVDVPARAQEVLDALMGMYTNNADGIPGNDDLGQMSAWFVFSALGLYPVDPCDGSYSLGRPLVHRAQLLLEAGVTLDIVVHNQSVSNRYVESVTWNGVKLFGTELAHSELIRGGELFFIMGSLPVNFRLSDPLAVCGDIVRLRGRSDAKSGPCTCGRRVCLEASQCLASEGRCDLESRHVAKNFASTEEGERRTSPLLAFTDSMPSGPLASATERQGELQMPLTSSSTLGGEHTSRFKHTCRSPGPGGHPRLSLADIRFFLVHVAENIFSTRSMLTRLVGDERSFTILCVGAVGLLMLLLAFKLIPRFVLCPLARALSHKRQ